MAVCRIFTFGLMYRWIPVVLFAFHSVLSAAQTYPVKLDAPDNRLISRWLQEQPRLQDSATWAFQRNQLLNALHHEGYLLAHVTAWKLERDTVFLAIDPGQRIYWAKISFRALEFLPPHWVKELDVSGDIVSYQKWRENVSAILRSAQSEGYLFASYQLNVIELKNDSLKAEVIFEPGLKIVLDSIEVEGSARMSPQYLEKTLGIRRGEPVTPEDLKTLQQQLNNLRFVQQTTPPVLILLEDKATIRVYLNNRNASSFDILAGLQPAPTSGKLALTGYVELDLVNQLTRGERIYIHIEKLRPRSQELEMALSYPYLLDLPFGVEGDFRLQKNDTLYSELEWNAGIFLPLGKNQFLRAGVKQQATNIISIDKARIISSKKLPSYVDTRINGFTLGLLRNRLDYDINPRKGYSISLDGSFSQRKVKRNDEITGLSDMDTSFNYASLYDSLEDIASRIALEGAFQYFIPWGSRSTIRLAVDGGILHSGERIFSNELFRLGGYEKLRGFDEESILAQFYTLFTAEYRLLIGGEGYISLFGDYAWIKNQNVEAPYEDRPFGFGIGLNLETTAGIFGVRAAVGAERGNAIDLSDARLHFGYVNRF